MSQQDEVLQIEGMSCNHCVQSVKNSLGALEGVEIQTVTIGSARVQYNDQDIPRSALIEAIEDIGFEVTDHLSGAEE